METVFVEANQDMGVHIDGANLGPHILTDYFADSEIDIYAIDNKNLIKERDKDNNRKNLKYVNEFNTRLYHRVQDCMLLIS